MPPDFPGSPGRLTTSMVDPLEPQISDSGTDHRNDDHEVFSRSLPSGLNCSRTPWSGAKALRHLRRCITADHASYMTVASMWPQSGHSTARTTKWPKLHGHLDAARLTHDTTGLRDRLTTGVLLSGSNSACPPTTPGSGSTRAARTTAAEATTMRQGSGSGTPVETTRAAVLRRRTSPGLPPR